jgi:hypothetical protein
MPFRGPARDLPFASVRLRRLGALLLGIALIGPAMPLSAAASPAATLAPTASPSPADTTLTVALSQRATSYNATTNTAVVQVTATPSDVAAPWQYTFAVRGTTASAGSSSDPAVTVTLNDNCSITTQSVTVTITDAGARTASAAGTLDRSLCPAPPNVAHAADRIVHGPTLTETSFVDRLRAVGSPALAEARQIYRALVAGGINPAFALGTFQAESASGTRGYAVTTLNWGNILYYSWEAAFGAVPYKPGNGYTYARYPTWLASVQAYVDLLDRYDGGGYTTVSSASAHWLGTIEGSPRHLTYLTNITAVMKVLPTDAVPVVTALTVPATSRAAVAVAWTASDDKRVAAYQIRTRLGTGAWSGATAVAGGKATVTLGSGSWTIGLRAADDDANWSPWRYSTVAVDAVIPVMSSLSAPAVTRSSTGLFSAQWAGRDAVGVTRYQYRVRRTSTTTAGKASTTTTTSHGFKLASGSWYVDVRAGDAVGNWSAWREIRVVVPADDRSYKFSSGTVRRTSSLDYRGTLTTTARAGAHLTATFTGTRFYLIGRSGPAYGRMRITIDGHSSIVDSGRYGGPRAKVTRHAVVLFSKGLAAGRHVVTITNLATAHRPTIGIDGLGFVR